MVREGPHVSSSSRFLSRACHYFLTTSAINVLLRLKDLHLAGRHCSHPRSHAGIVPSPTCRPLLISLPLSLLHTHHAATPTSLSLSPCSLGLEESLLPLPSPMQDLTFLSWYCGTLMVHLVHWGPPGAWGSSQMPRPRGGNVIPRAPFPKRNCRVIESSLTVTYPRGHCLCPAPSSSC